MKKVNWRNTIILIVLSIVLIMEILAFGLSQAKNIKEINTTIIDYNNLLENETIILNAVDNGESGYCITLPETINNKIIFNYYIKQTNILDDETSEEINLEKKAGDKVYLTKKELSSQSLTLSAVYDTKEVNEESLYNKKTEEKEDASIGISTLLSADNIENETVIYVSQSSGNNNNNGLSPERPVQTIAGAYAKLLSTNAMNANIIVVMGNYSEGSIFANDAVKYGKNATITGMYQGINYNAKINCSMEKAFLNGNTTFQYLIFNGGISEGYPGEMDLFAQGYSLTMGNGLNMEGFANVSTNNGVFFSSTAPAFNIYCGWERYNQASLPRTNAIVTIKSGTYARIVGGGTYGKYSPVPDNVITAQTVSRNFTGSINLMYNLAVNIDIQESTTNYGIYPCDINTLVGGGADANIYANITQNISGGKIGRIVGGNMGSSAARPSSWNYPLNSFFGSTTINISGGEAREIYGANLGNNLFTNRPCDSYFYGKMEINISGGTINGSIYGAGAGAITGYATNSSDTYKSYGQAYQTSVNINISGGIINADIYGGGYGYSDYLTSTLVTAVDGGALYGNSNIKITGGSIDGNIYGAGRGTNIVANKTELAQMIGNSNIEISGTPNISGAIYGGGKGISGMNNMAKLTGNTTIKINANLSNSVYGGGNIAHIMGNTYVYIEGGNHTGYIYGGGNTGIINGISHVYKKGGISSYIYGGGNAPITLTGNLNNTEIHVQGGETGTLHGRCKHKRGYWNK